MTTRDRCRLRKRFGAEPRTETAFDAEAGAGAVSEDCGGAGCGDFVLLDQWRSILPLGDDGERD